MKTIHIITFYKVELQIAYICLEISISPLRFYPPNPKMYILGVVGLLLVMRIH